ncbi:hypothetical protein DXG01_009951 [Tephrocybe rancida]|nr:hypothetical protein DXG01_009951 [Tephrocybe rancida]
MSFSILATLQSDEPFSAVQYYPTLVTELRRTAAYSSSKPPPTLTRKQLLQLLDALATSGRPEDLQRIEEILEHMPSMFGVELTSDIHTVIIRGLVKHGNDHTIHKWILNMPLRPTPFTPTLEQYHILLEACLKLSPFKFLRHVVREMRSTGCKPTSETFKYLVRSRWDAANQEGKKPHLKVFSSILDDMQLINLPYDESFAELLYTSYGDYVKWGKLIKDEYRTRFLADSRVVQFGLWNAKLSDIAQDKGVEAAMDYFFKTLVPRGCEPTPQILRAILRHSKTLDDVLTVRERFDVPPSVDHFSILITNNVRAGNIAGALAVYDESKVAGIVPDAALVHPLIQALCAAGRDMPTDESLDRALTIYHDLAAVAAPSPEVKANYSQHATGPDASIYYTLLRGCAISPNLNKYFPIAKQLLDDMENHDMMKNDSTAASSIIVLFMRRAENVTDALEAYYGLRSSLDEKGYAIVLDAFSKLSFNNELPVPSLTRYFGIVKDMRRAGLEITIEVYTTLLRQIALVPKMYPDRLTSDYVDELVVTTRRVHDFLTLDAAVSPDEQIWNQLMNTYQHLECFGDAYRVWETMYLSGRFNHVSVSIILDACGYAGAWQIAKKICAQLFRDRFSFNLHNWNTWVECLCRMRRLNDALKVVCLEMGKHGNTVPPDVETARILIKFARRDGMEADTLQRLEQYLPDLWKRLPEDLRNTQH